jgi:HSP20 family molecular chaperone IbpA
MRKQPAAGGPERQRSPGKPGHGVFAVRRPPLKKNHITKNQNPFYKEADMRYIKNRTLGRRSAAFRGEAGKGIAFEGVPNTLEERCGMSEKTGIDLGKIMDEIFEKAGKMGSTIQQNLSLSKLEEKIRSKWDENTDYYPAYSYPPLNVYMKPDKTLVFEFAMAGFEEKEFDLSFRGDYMMFSAKAAEDMLHEEGVRYFKRRLRFKDVSEQRYYVPADKFDREKVCAVFRHGVLKVEVPPRQEAVQVETIKIRISGEGEAT